MWVRPQNTPLPQIDVVRDLICSLRELET